jgi:hypothetical protein
MCRSRSTLLIFAVITSALVPISIIMLLVDNTSDNDSYHCPSSFSGGSSSSAICVSCDNLAPRYTTQATISEYLQDNGIAPANFGWPAPATQTDWVWFFQYICVEYPSMSSTSSNSSSSGGIAAGVALDDLLPLPEENIVTAADSSSPLPPEEAQGAAAPTAPVRVHDAQALSSSSSSSSANMSNASSFLGVQACCCGDTISTTNTLLCPSLSFHVSVWTWLWFVILVFGSNGVLLSILGYVFLECGCIESSKGPLELIADDLHLRRSEGR